VGPEALLELYRQRGMAEHRMGELMNVIEPALSSSSRSKAHYRGRVPRKRAAPCDAFAHNEALLLLAAMAYELVHVARVLLEISTGEGWSLLRVRERVLRVAGRVLLHARRVVLVINDIAARLWNRLVARVLKLHPVET